MTASRSDISIDNVYDSLREMIFAGVLQGGQKLIDRDIASQLGVSRTPVREALGRLAMTDLVEKRERRGYYVTKFSASDVADLYEFRKMLEVHAAKLAVLNAQPADLEEFESILEKLEKLSPDPRDHHEAVKLDLEIHACIAKASGNRNLFKTMQYVLDKVMCFIWIETSNEASLAAAHRQHKALLRCIANKDPEGAAKLIKNHIDSAQSSLLKVLEARDEVQNAFIENARLRKENLN